MSDVKILLGFECESIFILKKNGFGGMSCKWINGCGIKIKGKKGER